MRVKTFSIFCILALILTLTSFFKSMHHFKLYYKTTRDCYFCPFIAKCPDRRNAKKSIDQLAIEEKQIAMHLNLMPAYKNQKANALFSGIIHRSKKSRKRFLKHLRHDFDVRAAVVVWNNPCLLKYVSPNMLGDTNNASLDKTKLLNKIKRHVVEYHTYEFEHDHRLFTVKTELTTHGYEQFYALYEYRNAPPKSLTLNNECPT